MASERKQKLGLAVGEQVPRCGASQFREITTPEEVCSLRIIKIKRGAEGDQADAKPSTSAAPEGGGRPWRVSDGLPETAPICKGEVEVFAPSAKPAMKPESRDALLTAIAQARRWIEDIRLGRIVSFAEIAEREAQGERHIRLLAPLAFVSPRIIAAIVDGTAPADLRVTGLAKALAYSWAEQEQSVGLPQ